MTEGVKLIEVKEDILADNDKVAADLRSELKARGTFLLNLMASPGAGKTSLVLRTIEALRNKLEIGVVEADIDSTVDADRVAECGISAVQLRTCGFCHVDATMMGDGIAAFGAKQLDMIILENVGNLVCPAEFDTGAARNVMILSVPEGDDKPLKYPLMFSICNAILINKIDYLGLSDFDVKKFRERVHRLNPDVAIFEVSCKAGDGLAAWSEWLLREVNEFQRVGLCSKNQ